MNAIKEALEQNNTTEGRLSAVLGVADRIEGFIKKFLENFEDCEYCNGKGTFSEDEVECRVCHGTGKHIVSIGVLYVDLPQKARELLGK